MKDHIGKSIDIAKLSISFIDGFLQDFQPFRDMLEELGYVDKYMKITPKGDELLEKHWKRKYNL